MPTLSDFAAAADMPEEHGRTFRDLATSLVESGRSGADEAIGLRVPGRIEVLGKHTDYAGGRSLTCATEQGFSLVASARADRGITILDLGRGDRAELALDPEIETATPDWTRYARAVARRLARDFGDGDLVGADIGLISDLPPASGMSSSSALVVALAEALSRLNRLEQRESHRLALGTRELLAGYLGAMENGRAFGAFEPDQGVGTFGGSEDHTAILCSTPGHVGQYSYAPVRAERSIPLPEGQVFVVASSGVRAKKTGEALDAYNRASLAAAAAAEAWRRVTGSTDPDLGSILESGVDRERLLEVVSAGGGDFTGAELRDRVEHFDRESRVLVPQAGDALELRELAVFGLLVDRSQHLAERLLGNQIPETAALAEGARELGAAAASAFGAGFGGAVWALVEEQEADEFADSWLGNYLDRFPEREEGALALVTRPAEAAREIAP